MRDTIFRPARNDDLHGVLELYGHLNPDDLPVSPAAAELPWSSLLRSGLTTIFVAEEDGRLVSSCTLIVVPNLTRGGMSYALIENVVTHADYRRRGFGHRVLKVALEAAWAANCYKVMLATGSKQEATLRFYESVGFDCGGKTFFQARRP